MSIRGYRLGCPSWGLAAWKGTLYGADARAAEFLGQYSAVFNTVEGNTTFYSVPSAETVERWRRQTPESFRFCFKLPRRVTHERGLGAAAKETAEFFRRMDPLGLRAGPFMIQLPPFFGPDALPVLESFLRSLPDGLTYGVEVRHPDFFAHGEAEARLEDLLAETGSDRVVMDTRALRAGPADLPEIVAARRRKPDLPPRSVATGRNPMVRFVAHPDEAVSKPWMEEWAETVAGWIGSGLEPYVFVHSPDDLHAPGLARTFHGLLGKRCETGDLPGWPGEDDRGQLTLF